MNTKEIRVGNCIQEYVNNEWIELTVEPSDIKLIDDSDVYDVYRPLPITPDALFKLGAKEVKERLSTWYDLQVGDFDECMEIVEANDGHWCIELISVQPRGFEIPRHFHFIHEIQNLYFDLTGEQLKFEK